MKMRLNMFDLVKGFSGVVDMVNTTLADHHQRVGWLSGLLADKLNLSWDQRKQLVLASMLHDIGVIPLQDPADSLVFEKDMARHSRAGWLLLRICPILRREAQLLRHHHTDWLGVVNLPEEEREAGYLGNLIHLADMVDVYSRSRPNLPAMRWRVKSGSGSDFCPEAAEAMAEILASPDFLERLTEESPGLSLPPRPELLLEETEVVSFSGLFAHIIDSRSPFTAAHSSGVAHTALFLHQLADGDPADRTTMYVAGLLHDIGKMGVPLDLIEKPAALSPQEFAEVSRHAALSYDVLSATPGFERVAPWAAWHHERLNGTGYPGGLKGNEIPLEARLMAVADILTALTEDRPYRAGLDMDETLGILDRMVCDDSLDGDVVALVRRNITDVNMVRLRAQQAASKVMRSLTRDIQASVNTPAAVAGAAF